MSQSAASRTLDRLRKLFNDPLFIRAGYGMVPTSYAETLEQRVSEVLPALEGLFAKTVFSPEQTTREFRVGAVDNGVSMVLSHIIGTFLSQAPKALLDVVPAYGDLYKQLEDGRMDLAIYPKSSPPPDFHQALLFKAELIYLARKKHPLARYPQSGKLAPVKEVQRYQRLAINSYALPKIDYIGLDPEEDKLKTPLRIPYFLAAAAVLENTDLTLLLPRPTAEFICQRAPLVMVLTDPPQRKYQTRII